MSLISVVIPLYNKGKYVRRAVDSVLGQTVGEFELIVVNDGSTDNGPARVREFRDSRIRMIDQENRGVSAARNRGITEARGRLIAFLDADDEWKCTFLQTIESLAADYPAAGLYTTGYRIVMPDGTKRDARFKTIKPGHVGLVDNYFINAYADPVVTSNTAVIPRRVFDHVGLFDEGVRFGEDLLMWYKIALSFDVVIHNTIHATYWQNVPGWNGLARRGANIKFYELLKGYYNSRTFVASAQKRKWARRYCRYLVWRKYLDLGREFECHELFRLTSYLVTHR